MEQDTLRLLGKALRERLPLEDVHQAKTLQRLIDELERREPERDRNRGVSPK